MLRNATPTDRPAVLALVIAAGMFAPDEVGVVDELLTAHFADGAPPEGHGYLVDTDEEGRVVGVSYHQPTAAEGVTDLTMIAVDPELQGRGRGRAMIERAEKLARAAGSGLLSVDTSGIAQYDQARAFYRARGYVEVEHVADHWGPGDDLVRFTKPLS